MIRPTFLLLALALVAPAVPAAELSKRGALMDRVAAIVNDNVVTTSELDEQVAMITERLAQQRTALPDAEVLRKQVLDRLIVQEVQLQRASRVGIKVSDEQLNAALADVAQRNNMRLADLPRALASQGIDYAGYRDNMRKEITLNALRAARCHRQDQRHSARAGAVHRAPEAHALRDDGIQRLAHPHRRAARRFADPGR
jgi:peptidyl-prolyl cis-trans isomerase SurA